MGSKSGALHGFGAEGKPTASWQTTGRWSWGMSPVTNDHCAGKCLPLRRFDIWEVAGTSPLPRRQGALSLFFRLYDPPDGKAFKC
ncbi:hypothetical protein KQS06HV_90649 [Klebsiella quasipneumoniae subsp. similipneumoniae]|nr:hypothetical protein KQS06HV_90649 [Klebsiella quasipneumoniae subsp. similipneumoniae]